MSFMKKNDNTLRVIIVTDSVGMPREGLYYKDTWISMIKNRYTSIDFIDRPMRGGTTARLVTEGGGGRDLLELYQPGLVILQTGITDCAPRLFDKSGFEYRVINSIMSQRMRNKYIAWIRKRRIRNPDLAYIKPDEFRKFVSSYAGRAAGSGCKIIIIGILPPTSEFIRKSPYIKKSIDTYNEIYRAITREFDNVTFINPFENETDIDKLFIDEMHVNRSGSEIIYNSLCIVLDHVLEE